MRALLFSMPDIFPTLHSLITKMPNLALASIAANCPNHEVLVGDLVLKRKNVKKAITKAINNYKPNIIGLSAMTFQYPTAVKVAKFIKEVYPDLPIAIGGYHATLMYKEIAKKHHKLFDFIFRGEADLSFNELLNQLESKNDFRKINGLSYKKRDKFIHNPRRPVEDLTKIKLPDRDSRIWKGYNYLSKKLDTIETSRGCLNLCKFCSIRRMYGQSRREYSINRIAKDIKNAKRNGTEVLFFVDDNITSDIRGIKRFEKLLDTIIKNGLNGIRYITQASCVGMGYKASIAKKMSKAGFDSVFLGMENVSEKNLLFLRKGKINNYTKRAIEYLRKNGIIVFGGLVLGNEEDTEKDFKINYDYLIKSYVDTASWQILTPYPKTELRKEMIKKGLVTNIDDWSTYSGYFANVKTRHLSTEDLNFLYWKYSNKHETWQMKNFWKLNAFKKHPYFFIFYSLFRNIERIPSFFKKIGKSEREKFSIDFEKVLNLNKNLI